ncbi:Hypothetical predicted protein [Lecanosticta acicola]|uniref:Uncharacterized protein n=1 Tax=Lecanosticta acicola TaxID=111012 RepID=A0AAI8YUW0_9PEZI|nr:Hypothetical predicted protein [Lecanosticta acicola]
MASTPNMTEICRMMASLNISHNSPIASPAVLPPSAIMPSPTSLDSVAQQDYFVQRAASVEHTVPQHGPNAQKAAKEKYAAPPRDSVASTRSASPAQTDHPEEPSEDQKDWDFILSAMKENGEAQRIWLEKDFEDLLAAIDDPENNIRPYGDPRIFEVLERFSALNGRRARDISQLMEAACNPMHLLTKNEKKQAKKTAHSLCFSPEQLFGRFCLKVTTEQRFKYFIDTLFAARTKFCEEIPALVPLGERKKRRPKGSRAGGKSMKKKTKTKKDKGIIPIITMWAFQLHQRIEDPENFYLIDLYEYETGERKDQVHELKVKYGIQNFSYKLNPECEQLEAKELRESSVDKAIVKPASVAGIAIPRTRNALGFPHDLMRIDVMMFKDMKGAAERCLEFNDQVCGELEKRGNPCVSGPMVDGKRNPDTLLRFSGWSSLEDSKRFGKWIEERVPPDSVDPAHCHVGHFELLCFCDEDERTEEDEDNCDVVQKGEQDQNEEERNF